jgi:hypothetical protein
VADRYEPGINATFADMAARYATAVLPARQCSPRQEFLYRSAANNRG